MFGFDCFDTALPSCGTQRRYSQSVPDMIERSASAMFGKIVPPTLLDAVVGFRAHFAPWSKHRLPRKSSNVKPRPPTLATGVGVDARVLKQGHRCSSGCLLRDPFGTNTAAPRERRNLTPSSISLTSHNCTNANTLHRGCKTLSSPCLSPDKRIPTPPTVKGRVSCVSHPFASLGFSPCGLSPWSQPPSSKPTGSAASFPGFSL